MFLDLTVWHKSLLKALYGGLNNVGYSPVTSFIASCVFVTSLSISALDFFAAFICVNVWFPISWPSSFSLLTIFLLYCTFSPIKKNVAFTSYFFRISKTCGVNTSSGPSSNVSATTFSSSFPFFIIISS